MLRAGRGGPLYGDVENGDAYRVSSENYQRGWALYLRVPAWNALPNRVKATTSHTKVFQRRARSGRPGARAARGLRLTSKGELRYLKQCHGCPMSNWRERQRVPIIKPELAPDLMMSRVGQRRSFLITLTTYPFGVVQIQDSAISSSLGLFSAPRVRSATPQNSLFVQLQRRSICQADFSASTCAFQHLKPNGPISKPKLRPVLLSRSSGDRALHQWTISSDLLSHRLGRKATRRIKSDRCRR